MSIKQFMSSIELNHAALSNRPDVAGAVLGTVVSRYLPLPTGRVSSEDAFYSSECLGIVNDTLGHISNLCVMNAKIAARVAHALWLIRYNAAYPLPLTGSNPKYGFVDTYVRAGNVLSEADHAFLNEIKPVILCSAEAALLALRELFPDYFTIQA